MHRLTSITLIAFALATAAGCSCSEDNGPDGGVGTDGGGTGMDGSVVPPDGSTGIDSSTPSDGSTSVGDAFITLPDGNVIPRGPIHCQSHIYQCGNNLDDDGDGLMDDQDPNCLGPCDNNEDGLYLNIPGGDSAPCKLDCYYDQDQGSGNDECEWDARCDPLMPDPDPACAYSDPPPPSATCPDPQADACHDFCSPLTPNGCDCFGCCVRPGTTDDYRFIGSVDGDTSMPTCDIDEFRSGGDGCHPCTPVGDCLNGCGRCELCLGRDASDLPEDCFGTPPPIDAGTFPDGGPRPIPDAGPQPDGGTPIDVCSDPTRQDCGVPGLPPCPTGQFCITGCCTTFG